MSINMSMRKLPRFLYLSPGLSPHVARPQFRLQCRRLGYKQCTRHNSTQSQRVSQAADFAVKPFWTSGRVLLFSAFFSSLAYVAGMTEGSFFKEESLTQGKPPKYGSKAELEKAITELRSLLSETAISTDDEDLRNHGYSEWSSINADRLPVAIAYPESTEQVSQIAQICSKYKMPMVPYCAGSSLEGNFSSPYGGMCIDFSLMDKVLAVHAEDLDVVVQPAVQWMDLNTQIKDTGLFFPVDPGPTARIGGMVGTNCSGTNAVRYGTMKDNVLNLTIVLADGRIIKTRQRPRKTSAGYNLNGIFVGSEGTLGIVTEIALKLVPLPPVTNVGVVSFPSIRDAAATAMSVIRTGIQVQCMEIMDATQMHVVNSAGGTGRTWKEEPTLFFKFAGTKAGVDENIAMVKKIAKTNKGGKFEFARDEEEMHKLWSARKESLWSMLSMRRPGDVIWSTDVSVPVSKLADIIEISQEELKDLHLFGSILGHIGDGNFHESVMYNPSNPDETKAVKAAVYNMVDRALAMEGSCTGEHGVGIGKKSSLLKELGPETIGVMKSIKRALDPDWLLNPGKIFDFVDGVGPGK